MSAEAISSSPAGGRVSMLKALAPQTATDADEAISRNVDVISHAEQVTLRTSRLLVAGCGSVGGSVVEPLVRLGLGGVVLADPEAFELSNINRQACFVNDLGRSKAQVLAERCASINPQVETRVFREGLDEHNLDDAMRGVNIVFDGIDVGMSPWAKYALHELACAQHVPVLAGIDFGGKAVLYVFDYRQLGSRPFYGKASAEAHRERRFADCLKWLGYTHFPADFLPVIRERMESGRPWPQVSYCVQAMGAIGTRCALDVLMGRKVPHVVSFDTHMKARSPKARIVEYLRAPGRVLDTYLAVRRRGPSARNSNSEADAVEVFLSQNPVLQRVVAAMGRAPSPHNCQPWLLTLEGPNELSVGCNPSRFLPVVDPLGNAMAYSLGCAVEAAATIADIEWLPTDSTDLNRPDYTAGRLRIHGLKKEGFALNQALLETRCTNRHPFFATPIDAAVGARLAELAGQLGVTARLAQPNRLTLKRLTVNGASQCFRQHAYVEELLNHFRASSKEADFEASGMTADGLALDWFQKNTLKLLRDHATTRGLASALGATRAMAASAAANVERTGGFVLITARDKSVDGRLRAGRALMRVWLELTRQHLACQPVDFPISFAEGAQRVLELFGADEGEFPVTLLRVGRATLVPTTHSPRLPATEYCRLAPAWEGLPRGREARL